MHLRVEIRCTEAVFSAPLGPRGREPLLRAFLLLAALQVVGAFFRVID